MKKFFQFAAVLFTILSTQAAFAQNDYMPENCCPPQDQPCGDCWCLYCHYEPCYYNVKRCVEVPEYYKKKCCRNVPKYYEVKKCRYVPQYYTETCCKYVPEYYCVDECRTIKKTVCDRKCKYVPRYYYKHICGDNTCKTPCPTAIPSEPHKIARMEPGYNPEFNDRDGDEYGYNRERNGRIEERENFAERNDLNINANVDRNRPMINPHEQNWVQNRENIR